MSGFRGISKLDKSKIDNKKCATCVYRWNATNIWVCGYIMVEHRRRPCEGGSKCTAYRKGESIIKSGGDCEEPER